MCCAVIYMICGCYVDVSRGIVILSDKRRSKAGYLLLCCSTLVPTERTLDPFFQGILQMQNIFGKKNIMTYYNNMANPVLCTDERSWELSVIDSSV